jgi:hypothetical protein
MPTRQGTGARRRATEPRERDIHNLVLPLRARTIPPLSRIVADRAAAFVTNSDT